MRPSLSSMRLGTKLTLLVVLPFLGACVPLVIAVLAFRSADAGIQQAWDWTAHVRVAQEVQSATVAWLKALEDEAASDGPSDGRLAAARQRLDLARISSMRIAWEFRQDEYQQEKVISDEIVALVAAGDEALRNPAIDIAGVRHMYVSDVQGLILARIHDEQSGSARAVSAARERMRQAMIAAGVAAPLVLLLALVSVSSLVRRSRRVLRTLHDHAAAVSNGNLASRVPVEGMGHDELRDLGLAFNHMAEGLRDVVVTRETLEATVQQRTRELRELAESLEHSVEEVRRTQHQLVHTERMAAVGRLAAGVAHEVNNPLAFVMTNLDFLDAALRQHGCEPELFQAFGDMRAGLVRVRDIVRDLRAFARNDDRECGPVDVHAALDAAVQMASGRLRQRARLLRVDGDLPPVIGNSSRLTQVFLNLLVNALDAFPSDDTRTNEIQLRTCREHDGRIRIDVQDNGPGMSPAVLSRMFEPFFTTKPAGAGTGLGLSICRNIVEQLGGSITVQSEVAAGTCVRVLLQPADDAVAREPDLVPVSVPARQLRVVVIDDEQLVANGIRRALHGHHVRIYPGGAEALAHLAQWRDVDVILCDLMMPDMTGMDVFAALRTHAPEAIPRLIFMSGGTLGPQAEIFATRGDIRFLHKPFEVHELLAIAEASLYGRKAPSVEHAV